jgi:hypothetical protein
MKYLVSMESAGINHVWVIAEYEPGKRVTRDMITFDTNREDVAVNKYGVVLFYDTTTAKCLLSIDFPEVLHPFKESA